MLEGGRAVFPVEMRSHGEKYAREHKRQRGKEQYLGAREYLGYILDLQIGARYGDEQDEQV